METATATTTMTLEPSSHKTSEKEIQELASQTRFAGPLWLREEVGALYAKGEVHTGPFSMPLLVKANFNNLVTPPNRNLRMLDLCCGSGVTTHELQVLLKQQGLDDKVNLVCGNFSAGQLEYLNKRIQKMGWKNTVTRQMNAERNGEEDQSFDHVVCAQGMMKPFAIEKVCILATAKRPGQSGDEIATDLKRRDSGKAY